MYIFIHSFFPSSAIISLILFLYSSDIFSFFIIVPYKYDLSSFTQYINTKLTNCLAIKFKRKNSRSEKYNIIKLFKLLDEFTMGILFFGITFLSEMLKDTKSP